MADSDVRGRINRMYGGAAGPGKAVALSTRIPMPNGWSSMRDLVPGDRVFDESGAPCIVVWKSEPHYDPTGTYRLVFDDGAEVVCGGQHEWWTQTANERAAALRTSPAWRAKRRATRPRRGTGKRPDVAARNAAVDAAPRVIGALRTTLAIAETLRGPGGRANHSVAVSGAWQMPPADLPLDPYVLGVWLGDGTRGAGWFTSADPEIVREVEAAGFPCEPRGKYRWLVQSLSAALRAAGVFRDKHVPSEYFTASADQRLALLQGLMDTDGACGRDHCAVFTNTNIRLARAVWKLATSLGLKPSWRESRAMLYDKDCGPCYDVMWTSRMPVFRLPRKAARLPEKERGTQSRRYIVSCERIDDEPVQCIEVDSPSHQYLVTESGIPTHNSHSGRWDQYRKAAQIPGFTGAILRRTMPELKKTHLRAFQQDQHLIGAQFLKSENQLVFPNGSIIECGHCEDDDAVSKWLSSEYDQISIDEGSTFEPDMLLEISTRARSTKPLVKAAGGAWFDILTNPGGRSWALLRDLFVTQAPDYDVYPGLRGKYDPRQWVYIKALLDDNPYLDPEYEQDLAVLSEARFRQLRYGEEFVTEGAFFSEWRETRDGEPWHVQDIHIPEGAEWFGSMDWGYNAPGVMLWWAVLPDGHYHIAREFKFQGMSAEEVARSIKDQTKAMGIKRLRYLVCDPAMKAKTGAGKGESIFETLVRFGLPMRPGDNDRYNGWTRAQMLLSEDPRTGRPWLTVSESCRYGRRTMPAQVQDKHNPEDLDTNGDDHWPDAFRYGAMSRPAASKSRPPEAQDYAPNTWGWWRQFHERQNRPRGVLR